METNSKGSVILNDYLADIQPIHPGSILQEELRSRGIRQKEFASSIGMQPSHLSALIHGQRNITAAVAFKLDQALDIPAHIWLNLQNQYDLGKSAKAWNPHYPRVAVLMDSGAETYSSQRVKVSLSLPAEDIEILSRLAQGLGWKVD